MIQLVGELRVFPQRMLRNLESTQGLIFSGQLLQDLVEKGMPRDEAYKAVQENAMTAWELESSFRERVAKDERITKFMSAEDLERTFDLKRQLRNVDNVFARVFGAHPAGERGVANKA
jgi:adenylosuccinate lyase